MLHPDQARNIILDHTPAGKTILLPLNQIHGLILAQNLTATSDLPLFDNSAMDGYAVRHADLVEASTDHPVTLRNRGFVPAGLHETEQPGPGECYQIATGSEMPPGVDTVVMKESVTVAGTNIQFTRSPRLGDNVRYRGEDIQHGQQILKTGMNLGPTQIAVLAAFGYAEVPVFQPLKVAILSTGSELVNVEDPLAPGKIRDSNSHMFTALVGSEHCAAWRLGIVEDRPDLLEQHLKKAMDADMVLISGGVSVGDHDFVKDTLERLGVEEIFWKVSIKPGKPFFFGKKNETLVFGMPGNPASSFVVFEEFVRPSIRKRMGRTPYVKPLVPAVLTEPVRHRAGRQQYLRAWLDRDCVPAQVRPMASQGSHSLNSLSEANALIVVESNSPEMPAGTVVSVRPVS
ncbi:MAG: molybdopterin molybdotransferase MoeA [SAR324 cluster bacterium]|nr:molybdopterin molybdotransferase MoeA [SAR324 cluster bacterium]